MSKNNQINVLKGPLILNHMKNNISKQRDILDAQWYYNITKIHAANLRVDINSRMASLCIKQFFFTFPYTSFIARCFHFYISNIYVSILQFFNSYVYKRLAYILWVLYIILNPIIEVNAFFYCPLSCLTPL